MKELIQKKLYADLKLKIKNKRNEIYSSLTPWQKVQLSRHPQRPYTLDYISQITNGNFVELHGDRSFKDDKAIVGGWGSIDKKTYMFIGQQKEETLKNGSLGILVCQILKDTERHSG